MQTSAIPWKIKCDFNTLPTLFHGETLPYQAITYLCSCSHQYTYLENKTLANHQPYRCPICANETFLNANDFLKQLSWYDPIENIFPKEILYALEPTIMYGQGHYKLTSHVNLKIPYTINLLRNTIMYKEHQLFELSIDQQGKISQLLNVNFDFYGYDKNVYDFEDDLLKESIIDNCTLLTRYKTKIVAMIKSNKATHNLDIPDECTSINDIVFFIKYPYLKSYEFIYWKSIEFLPNHHSLSFLDALNFINIRKEKSIKKAFFEYYTQQIQHKKSFAFHYIYALLHHIKDPNIIIQILHLPLDISGDSSGSWELFFTFLTSHFDEKRIAHLLKQFAQEEDYWLIDTMELLSEVSYDENHKNIHYQEINSLRANYKEIHDYVVHIHSSLYKQTLSHQTFAYTHQELAPCIQTATYSVRVPYTGLELFEWGEKMHNCLAGYDRAILSKNKLIYGFFKEDELVFAIEIQERKIVQAKSKYNTELLSVEKDFLNSWFEQFFKVNNK